MERGVPPVRACVRACVRAQICEMTGMTAVWLVGSEAKAALLRDLYGLTPNQARAPPVQQSRPRVCRSRPRMSSTSPFVIS